MVSKRSADDEIIRATASNVKKLQSKERGTSTNTDGNWWVYISLTVESVATTNELLGFSDNTIVPEKIFCRWHLTYNNFPIFVLF